MAIDDNIKDEKLQSNINPYLGGGGVILPPVGFPLITQKR